MKFDFTDIAETLITLAKRAGADAAVAGVSKSFHQEIGYREGALETAETAETSSIGLRVFIGDQSATVSANTLSAGTFEKLAQRAVDMARVAPEDPLRALSDPADWAQTRDHGPLDLCDPAAPPSTETLIDRALALDEHAHQDGIEQVTSAGADYSHSQTVQVDSRGYFAKFARTHSGLGVVTLARENGNMNRDHDSDGRIYQSDLRDVKEIAQTAVERTLAMRGAVKPPSGKFPILMDERISASIIGHVLSAINGSSIVAGASWLIDDMDQQIFPTALSLIEEPHRKRASGSRLCDVEGLPTQRRALIENGILRSWILDLASARKLELSSTGNASGGVASTPSPSAWNVTLSAGTQTKEELLRDMGTGLLVTSFIGSTISGTTGDYSRGVRGFWVENGEIAYPVHEGTIASNLRSMVMGMIPANDAREHVSRRVPSLLIPEMTIAGA